MSAQYKFDAKWIFIQEWSIELKMFTNQFLHYISFAYRQWNAIYRTLKFTGYPQKQWNAVYRSTAAFLGWKMQQHALST